MEYNIKVSGCSYFLYPTELFFGLLWYSDDEALEIPKQYPIKGEWGIGSANILAIRETYPLPFKINVLWLSIVENSFYEVEEELHKKTMERIWNQYDKNVFDTFIGGMAPNGLFVLWASGGNKSKIVLTVYGKKVEVNMSDFLPFPTTQTAEQYCHNYICLDKIVKTNLEKKGLPPRDLFDNYMKQFTSRYQVAFEKWTGEKWEKYDEDEAVPVFDYIEEALFDGTHDKLHDGGLMKYHEAGKPKKLKVQFHVGGNTNTGESQGEYQRESHRENQGKAQGESENGQAKAIKKRPAQEYSAYFWFEDERIREVFDRFYGAHPDTKTDFIIKIDAERNKYQVAMYRYGLKEPVVLADDVYQLIVFRNKFECYRSDNYNQQRGAWIW